MTWNPGDPLKFNIVHETVGLLLKELTADELHMLKTNLTGRVPNLTVDTLCSGSDDVLFTLQDIAIARPFVSADMFSRWL